MPLKINGSTSGSVTLAAPATGSDVTLTLPTLGFGKVLQAVMGSTSTTVSLSSSTTWTDSGVTATITPSSTSSKILIMASMNGVGHASSGNDDATKLRLLRGAVDLGQFAVYGLLNQNSTTNRTSAYGNFGHTYLDSPSSTSAITYKVQFTNLQTTGTSYCQVSGELSTIVLIEIGP